MTEQGSGPAQPPYPREPNVHSGGKQEPGSDRDLPPYEGRQTTGKSPEELAAERGGTGSSEAGAREVSQAEREGMGDTDMEPAGPLGVGISTTKSGEDLSRGMSEAAQRKDRLDSGLSDEGNKDPASPATSSGDQGG